MFEIICTVLFVGLFIKVLGLVFKVAWSLTCNDSFYNGTPRIDRVFHFCGRTPLADFGWLTGTGLRTFKHITHLQDKPLATEKVTRGCF